MIFVTGAKYAGKRTYVAAHYPRARVSVGAEEGICCRADADALFPVLCSYDVVILPEMGCGVVPLEEGANERREAVGYLAQKLAQEADVVIRMVCGLPQVLKQSEAKRGKH